LPFSKLDQKSFFLNSQGIDSHDIELENISFHLNKSDKEITNQISRLIAENTDPDLIDQNFCSYYDPKDFLKSKFDPNNFSIFHLNIASLHFHIDELLILLELIDYNFDCIMISETKFQTNFDPKNFLEEYFPNYNFYFTPTNATKGGSLVLISKRFYSKPRKDLEVTDSKNIESTFAEIILPNTKNIIVGCIYKHHTITTTEFQNQFLPALQTINRENKDMFIAGDYNIDLLKLSKDKATNDYFENVTEMNIVPLITLPTRITAKS